MFIIETKQKNRFASELININNNVVYLAKPYSYDFFSNKFVETDYEELIIPLSNVLHILKTNIDKNEK